MISAPTLLDDLGTDVGADHYGWYGTVLVDTRDKSPMFTYTSRVITCSGTSRVITCSGFLRSLLCLGLVGALLMGGVAQAAPVAPLVPKMTPAKADEIVVRFHDALAKGLGEGGLEPLSTAHVRAKAKDSCGASACALRALRTLGGDRAAVATIRTVGKNYTIEVRLIGAQQAKVSGRCDICTLMEALSKTTKLAKQLATEAAAKKPVKAPVTAKTPTKTPMKTPTATKVPASSTAPKAGAKREGRRWPLWPVLAAAGVGVLGLAVGIPLVAMDGDPTNCRGEPRSDGRNCQDVYSTSGAGWTFTTMGIAGLATAGVLFYLYLTSPKRGGSTKAELPWLHRVSIAPAQGGLLMGASGTF